MTIFQITDKDIAFFREALPGQGRVLVGGTDDLSGYNTDWLKTVRGNPINKMHQQPKHVI